MEYLNNSKALNTNSLHLFEIGSLDKLRLSHPAWRLLIADHSPLIISFFYKVFIETNKRSIPYTNLISRLDDYLFHLKQIYGDEKFPRSAKEYINEWCNREVPFLRKFYTRSSDEAECDLTPATERVIEWVQSLEEKRFIGAESRLLTVFQLLKDIFYTTNEDPKSKIAELKKQRAEIDKEIYRIQKEGIGAYDPTSVKERYFQAEETARRLLSDFRQVEENFRILDRKTRERIAISEKTKGKLLDEIFAEQDIIRDSDQGKSFRAFWEFLMSPAWQEELQKLIKAVHELDEIKKLDQFPFLDRIKFYLLEAGEKVYKTSNLMGEQLRKYLDDQVYLENKRIMELIKSIEKRTVEIKDEPPKTRIFAHINQLKPDIDLVMTRTLFTPPKNPKISDEPVTKGETDIQTPSLYMHHYVNEGPLKENIRRALQDRSQISLKELTEKFPVKKGVAEIITYIHIAEKDVRATVDENVWDVMVMTSAVNKNEKKVRIPRTIFVREGV